MSSQIFDCKRFYSYLRYYVGANSQTLLLNMAIIFGAFLCCTCLPPLFSGFSIYPQLAINPVEDKMWRFELYMLIPLAFLFCAYSGSKFYKSMHGKQQRVNTLTIPVSSFEKWAVWFAIYVVSFTIFIFVSMWCADVIRVIICKLIGGVGPQASIIPFATLLKFGVHMMDNPSGDIAALVFVWASYLGTIATYSLGSIVFTKHSFLRTTCCIIALWIVWICAVIMGVSSFIDFGHYSNINYSNDEAHLVFKIVTLSAAVIAFIFWLGYFRFKQSESVNKW